MKYWITTDTHFGHQKMVDVWKDRPDGFEDLIWKRLEVVQAEDVLIHLGDVQLGKYKVDFHGIGRSRILVKGNHDKATDGKYLDMGFDVVLDSFALKRYGVRTLFTHRPGKFLGDCTYNIHGHTHGNAHRDYEHIDFYTDNHIELALEDNNYQPWNLESILVAKLMEEDV